MIQLYQNKFIPQNYLAEEILLGTIIIYPNIILYVTNILHKEHFFLEAHRIIYLNLVDNRKNSSNIINLLNQLRTKNLLYKIGGIYKIINIMKQSQIFISVSKINNYVEKLIDLLDDKYIRRLIVQYSYHTTKLSYITFINNYDLYSKLLSYLKFIEKKVKKNDKTNFQITSIKDLVSQKLLKIKYPTLYTSKNKLNTKQLIQSGFQEIDKITNGLPEGNLIIIAGRPSIGKTSFAINIVYNVFFFQQVSIYVFSLEMTSKEIVNRFISIACNLNTITNENFIVDKEQWNKVIKICDKLLHNDIYINDNNNIQIDYIEYTSIELKKVKNHVNLIVIDYLQLIEFSEKIEKKLNRSQELGYITRRLKLLAQVLKVPIIVLSQLNRNIEIRGNKEPLLSDLKESGCLGYKENINETNCKTINIKNISKSDKQITKLFLHEKNTIKRYYNHHFSIEKNIKLSHKQLFTLKLDAFTLTITNNHRFLSEEKWVRIDSIQKLTSINIIQSRKIKKNKLASQRYIQAITSSIYYKTYDIKLNDVFHFICRQVVMHNSIEQDADIIIMLHSEKEKQIDTDKNIIDIKVSKNRNGHTGTCEIVFMPKTVQFSSINNTLSN